MPKATDNPPILTALAPGHATVTAGAASADVTVWDPATLPGGMLPLGTVLWSNPGNGSGVQSIVPAAPSPDGVADVFAFQNDGTVQAITSDGTVAWTANLNPDSGWLASAVPDFQGGLVAEIYSADGEQQSIMKFDGITGQPYPAYTAGGASSLYWNPPVVHPDGTIFVLQQNWTDADHDGVLPSTVVGIDPTTGVQKFSVPMEPTANTHSLQPLGLIIAGDGYAYVPYQNDENLYYTEDDHLRLLRVGVDGTYEDIDIFDSHQEMCCEMPPFPDLGVITNADQGVVLSWQAADSAGGRYLAVVQGGGVSVTSGPSLPTPWGVAIPVLQAQDGSFVGVWNGWDDDGNPVNDMLAFDASSNIRWIVPGNWQPRIATADGGVIATQMDDNYNPIGTVVFDQTGAATGMMAGLPVQSWAGNSYEYGSVERTFKFPLGLASSFWAAAQANLSGNLAAAQPLPDRVNATYDVVQADPLGGSESVFRSITYTLYQGRHRFLASNGQSPIIAERLLYSYGQHPTAASVGGVAYYDQVGTRGKGDFGLTQQFFVTLNGARPYRVQIMPCTSVTVNGLVGYRFGKPTWQNINNVTTGQVLINGDPGSTDGRACSQ